MYKGLRVGVVVAAAGESRRMGGGIKKQYLFICDKPVLAHTLAAINSSDLVDEIIIAAGEDEMEYCRKNIIEAYEINKVSGVVKGGKERQQSVFQGLLSFEGKCGIAVIHDGARPFVTAAILDESIREAYEYGAAACAVPVKDTIKVADKDGWIVDTPDRSHLYAVQTPQTFKFDLIFEAHKKARNEGYTGTDDTVLVERMGTRVKIFDGSYENMKITTPEDIYMAEAMFRCRGEKEK